MKDDYEPGANQEQGISMSRSGAGQKQGKSRVERTKAEQGRNRAGAGLELGMCRIPVEQKELLIYKWMQA